MRVMMRSFVLTNLLLCVLGQSAPECQGEEGSLEARHSRFTVEGGWSCVYTSCKPCGRLVPHRYSVYRLSGTSYIHNIKLSYFCRCICSSEVWALRISVCLSRVWGFVFFPHPCKTDGKIMLSTRV